MHLHPHAGKYFLLGLTIICGVIFIDQYSKWLVIETVLRQSGPVSGGFMDWFTTRREISFFVDEREHFRTLALVPWLSFVMVWNQGISFGMLDTNSPLMPLVFITLSLLISAAMVIWLALNARKAVAIALGLIIGGALANVMDRVRFNAVADFIDVHAGAWHWPAFNVADSCIVIGAGILMFRSFLGKESV
jgi:signal peptidase II